MKSVNARTRKGLATVCSSTGIMSGATSRAGHTYNGFPREVFLLIKTWMWKKMPVRTFQHGFKKICG